MSSSNCPRPMMFLLVFILLSFSIVLGVTEVQVVRKTYNFATLVSINSTGYEEVVDTGSFRFFNYVYNFSSPAPQNETGNCLSLSLDGTDLRFQSDLVRYNCFTQKEIIDVGGAVAVSNVTTAPYLYIENSELHDWYKGSGVMGLSYCLSGLEYDCNYLTPFQRLIQNASGMSDGSSYLVQDAGPLVFGLDLRADDGSAGSKYVAPNSYGIGGSAMQLGAYDAQFAKSLVWTQQASQSPQYHEFYANNLDFCGAQILGNFSTNWNMLVDTGSVCLTLPSSIYDSFADWLDVDGVVVEDVNALPAFSFQVGEAANTTTLYIPLADLLVNASAIIDEPGTPAVSVRDGTGGVQQMRLCVLRGSDITYRSAGSTEYYSSAPDIVLGSLALQSIYLAADFSQYSVGLANKLSASYIDGFGAGKRVGCAAVRNCTGDQTYMHVSNQCSNPQCARYFFTELDSDTMTCEPNTENMAGGLIFVILIALAETASFLVTQYSAHMALGTPIDPLTKLVGSYLTVLVDLIVVYLLSWAPRPYSPRTVAAAQGGGAGDHFD